MATILVIEDDPFSADIITRILKRAGHEVIHASEGLTGLNLATQEKVDLVLLDMGLPDIGGHTIAAYITKPIDTRIFADQIAPFIRANDDEGNG